MPSLPIRPVLTILALALTASAFAAVPAPTTQAALRGRQPELAARAQGQLLELRSQLCLGAEAGFMPRRVATTPEGRTVVRLQQTHQGLRVWGAEAVAHVEASGEVKAYAEGLQRGITLAGEAAGISAEAAKAIALKQLAPKGPLGATPVVEEVVFPTRFTGGMASRWDPATGRATWDRELSIAPRRQAEAFVRASGTPRTATASCRSSSKPPPAPSSGSGTSGRAMRRPRGRAPPTTGARCP